MNGLLTIVFLVLVWWLIFRAVGDLVGPIRDFVDQLRYVRRIDRELDEMERRRLWR